VQGVVNLRVLGCRFVVLSLRLRWSTNANSSSDNRQLGVAVTITTAITTSISSISSRVLNTSMATSPRYTYYMKTSCSFIHHTNSIAR